MCMDEDIKLNLAEGVSTAILRQSNLRLGLQQPWCLHWRGDSAMSISRQ